jgi:hypothetical protein
MRDLNVRLDQIEHESAARLDKLSERVDQDSSTFADIAARLDRLEKKAAAPATSASESADVAARLDKLEKKVAAAAAPASEIEASGGEVAGFRRASFRETDPIGGPAGVAGLAGAGAGADSLTCAAAAPFCPSASKRA